MWLKSQWSVVFAKNIFVFTLSAAWHTVRLFLMIPPSLSTSSRLTCTPIRLSTRPSAGPLQNSSSDEIYLCDDPVIVSFDSLADLHQPTGYELKDLAEEDNPVQVKPSFF